MAEKLGKDHGMTSRTRARAHLRSRRLASVAVLVVTALVGAAFTAPPAVAEYSSTPRPSTWSPTDGRVYAIERVGDTIFIGGSFTTLRNPAGTATVARSRLAAFDAVTGDLLPWNPGANNEVRALQGSSDGTGLFVGGRFTSIAGAARNRLAQLRTDTGALMTSFNANVNATVMALERIGTRVFLGGTFGTVNGAARSRVAAMSESTGALAPGWTGSANGAVNSIVAAPEGDRVFLGGQFRSLSGQSRDFLGALSVADGSATAWRPPSPARTRRTRATCSTLRSTSGRCTPQSADRAAGERLRHRQRHQEVERPRGRRRAGRGGRRRTFTPAGTSRRSSPTRTEQDWWP
jgi:hypothetical protein